MKEDERDSKDEHIASGPSSSSSSSKEEVQDTQNVDEPSDKRRPIPGSLRYFVECFTTYNGESSPTMLWYVSKSVLVLLRPHFLALV